MTVRLTRGIYEASADDLLGLIRQWGGTARSLLLIGHNPAIEDLAQSLAPSGDEPALTRLAAKFPTAALAVIDFGAAEWSEIGSGAGRLAAYHTPE
jgi:phosphohistidine phosphatase